MKICIQREKKKRVKKEKGNKGRCWFCRDRQRESETERRRHRERQNKEKTEKRERRGLLKAEGLLHKYEKNIPWYIFNNIPLFPFLIPLWNNQPSNLPDGIYLGII